MSVLLSSLFLASALVGSSEPVLTAHATAAEMIESCRTMLPREVSLKGRLVLRNRRGIVQSESAYVLTRSDGKTSLWLDGKPFTPSDELSARSIAGTDVTWSDLSLDYLWWPEAAFDAERESETVHGQVCDVIVLKKDNRCVRVWVDRKTGAMMQAEEWTDGKAIRRLWGTRIKKFGDRWAPNVLEVETLGSGHRTKITVEELK